MFKQAMSLPVVANVKPAGKSEALTPQAPKSGYSTPQLFAVGQTVELIQGYAGGPYRDRRTGFYYNV